MTKLMYAMKKMRDSLRAGCVDSGPQYNTNSTTDATFSSSFLFLGLGFLICKTST
jgi:hypothetical protein